MKTRIFNHIKSIISAFWLVVLLCNFGLLSPVLASGEFKVQGKLFFADDDVSEIAVNNISVKTFKIGSADVYQAEVKKDGRGQVTFSIVLNSLQKNDQLLVLAQADQDKGLFGGLSTVVTEKELSDGIIANLTISLKQIPVPEYEEGANTELKTCWKGMDDFSVVGYEVYRSEDLNLEFTSIGRAGQTAGRQVCYVDTKGESGVKYYYKLGILNSWNAGAGKEVMISEAMGLGSNGLMLGKGIVERNKPVVEQMESDLTLPVLSENKGNSTIDKYLNYFKNEIEKTGWSYQTVLLVVIGIVLLLVIGFFVLSVEFANVRSKGSVVWERRVVKSIFVDKEDGQKKK